MFIPPRPLNRRTVLRAGAASVALPWLGAMGPSLGQRALATGPNDVAPRRMVAMCAGLGFHAPNLFPDAPGPHSDAGQHRDAVPLSGGTRYLDTLKDHWDKLSLFSGLSHPNQQGNNGHASQMTFLTSAPRPGLAGFRNTVSIDQRIARQVGDQTRVGYLALSVSGKSLSWTDNGVPIPSESSPARLFKRLFIDGKPDQVKAEIQGIRRGRSILDSVAGRARTMHASLGTDDQAKLDEYLSSVRDLESRLQQSEDWVKRPKPVVDQGVPEDINDKSLAIEKQRLMNDMIVLALQTDSTRVVTHSLGGLNSPPKIPGVKSDWHGLSHHGKDPAKIDELALIEQAEFEVFNEFLGKLRAIDEGGTSLLDHTAILFGSNLGNASAHDWHNLPIIIAGGGFRHGHYVAHDREQNTPLANVFVSLAQHMGVETDQFGSSTAAGITGLDRA